MNGILEMIDCKKTKLKNKMSMRKKYFFFTQLFWKKCKNFNTPKLIDNLFIPKSGIIIEIEKKQCIERIVHFILFVLLLVVCYKVCNFIGKYLAKDTFDSSFLYGVFLIPLFYYITDFQDVFAACFVKAIYCKDSIIVINGFLYRSYDKLYLHDIDNIELHRSFGGKLFGYCSLDFYSFGGALRLPFVKDNKHNLKIISELMTELQNKKQGNKKD